MRFIYPFYIYSAINKYVVNRQISHLFNFYDSVCNILNMEHFKFDGNLHLHHEQNWERLRSKYSTYFAMYLSDQNIPT